MTETKARTYWLSFVDGETGTFSGVVIVDVTDEQAEAERERLNSEFPNHDRVNGLWVAACARAAWDAKVNPGGEVGAIRIDDEPWFPEVEGALPRLVLLDRKAVDAANVTIEAAATSADAAGSLVTRVEAARSAARQVRGNSAPTSSSEILGQAVEDLADAVLTLIGNRPSMTARENKR